LYDGVGLRMSVGMRIFGAFAVALMVALSGCGGCGADLSGPAKEIVSESIEKEGDTWKVSFVSTIDAPVDKVWEAFRHPERAHEHVPEAVLKSELVSETGNVKVVDVVGRLEVLPPGFKVQNLRNEYTYYPDEKRFTSRSIDFSLADISSEFKLEPSPDGSGTVVRVTQTNKTKAPMIVESLQKGAIKETYITQIRAVNKALGIADAGTDAKS
jgi:ligand-binding SRPBCC domain-containing protein